MLDTDDLNHYNANTVRLFVVMLIVVVGAIAITSLAVWTLGNIFAVSILGCKNF